MVCMSVQSLLNVCSVGGLQWLLIDFMTFVKACVVGT
jgi:hypothetical protein